MRKLRKIGLAVAAAFLCLCAARAGDREKVSFHGGLEWGYCMTAYEWAHYNYQTLDGQRMNPYTDRFTIGWNAALEAYGEMCLWKHYALRLAGGRRGIAPERTGWSVAARASVFFRDYRSDTPFAFAEYAQVYLPSLRDQHSRLVKAGGGYRVALGSWVRFDILASVQYSQDHPYRFYDKIQGAYVEGDYLRRSDLAYATLNLSFALNF